MSRLKRWLHANKKEVNLDGTIKEECINEMSAKGLSQRAIDVYVGKLKAEYERLKHLDETNPEPEEPTYTAWDFFTEEEKRRFNPDGTLKVEFWEKARSQGYSQAVLFGMEYRKMVEVQNYNAVSAKWAARGDNFGASEMRRLRGAAANRNQNLKQMRQDLRNGEDIAELPWISNQMTITNDRVTIQIGMMIFSLNETVLGT